MHTASIGVESSNNMLFEFEKYNYCVYRVNNTPMHMWLHLVYGLSSFKPWQFREYVHVGLKQLTVATRKLKV